MKTPNHLNHQPPTVAPRLNSFISSCANFASNSWGAMAAPEDPNVGNKNQHHWSRKVAGDEWSKKMCSHMRMFLTYIFWKKGWPLFAPTDRHLTGQPRTLHWSQKMATGLRIPAPRPNPVTLKTSNSCLLPSYHVFCIYFVHEGRDWIWIHQIRHGDMQVKCCFWFCIHYHTAFASPVFKRLEEVMLLHDSL